MTVTLITASFIGLLLLALSFNVVRFRHATKTSVGTGNNRSLEYAVRAQANLIEYAPITLILMGLLEYRGVSFYLVLGMGATFVVARIAHGIGLGILTGANILRSLGTLFTWVVLLVACVTGLTSAYNIF